MSLAERRWLRLFTLCALYVAQGIPWGFTAYTIPAYLAGKGLSTEAVGTALAMTTLPYTFKVIWGPIIDAFTIPSLGRRRPWIVFAQGMMALTILSMIAIPDLTVDLKILAWMILIHTVFNSMQDVAVDALAVDLLDERERGRANGLMYASKYGGGIIGGAGMSTIVGRYGLSSALIVQTIILLAIMLLPLLVRERSGPPPARPALRLVLRSLAEAFSIRSTVIAALLMLSVNVAAGVLTANSFVLFTQRLGWKSDAFVRLTSGLGLAAGLGGSVIGGFLADVVGRRRMIALASIAMALGWVVFALAESWWTNDVFVYTMAIFDAVVVSILTVSLFALCMDVSWPEVAATQFTSYMALLNFSTTLGYMLAGRVHDTWDFATMYIVVAIGQLAVTGLLLFIDPGETRRTLPHPPGTPITVFGIVAAILLALVLVVMVLLVVVPFAT